MSEINETCGQQSQGHICEVIQRMLPLHKTECCPQFQNPKRFEENEHGRQTKELRKEKSKDGYQNPGVVFKDQ